MREFFDTQKSLILETIDSHLQSRSKEFAHVNPWGGEIPSRIRNFTSQGKMIRGSLVVLAHNLFGGTSPFDALKAAAAMELFQSAFLIHDDIMDRDTIRRGNPSFFYQYKTQGESQKINDPYHYGESIGICAGDLAFFIGYEFLASLITDQRVLSRILSLTSHELGYVGLAQMQDVHFGNMPQSPDDESILKLYLYKTGRYTFSLPLMTGGIIAQTDEMNISTLAEIGELLGILFQIKDDELGIFADSDELGKPVGSDIKENKKTLLRNYLFSAADESVKEKLNSIFGSESVSTGDVMFIRDFAIQSGVRDSLTEMMKRLADDALEKMDLLDNTDDSMLEVLKKLLQYSINRTK